MTLEAKRRILIVDDTPANLLALRVVLEPLGAEIVQAASGREALAYLKDQKCDAVVMDVRMPGLDGFETASRMRVELKDINTPILFVTASDIRPEDVVAAYAQGQAELMPKPFVPEAMREKVKTFLELAAIQDADRQRADMKILEAEERLQLALRAAKMVAWVRDKDSDNVICSDGDVELYGFTVTSVKEFFEKVHPEDRVRVANEVEATWSGRQDLDVEYRVLMDDGSVRWIEAKGRLILPPIGSPRLFGVSMDITAKHNAQLELEQLAEELKGARDKALYATHAKTTFLNAFGHELKTPLNGIINYAEMIEEELPDEKFEQIRNDARKIRNLGAQLNNVVEQIFDLADLDKRMGLADSEDAQEP